MNRFDKVPTEIERWDTLTACVEAAKSRPNWARTDDVRFQGGTFAQAEQFATRGWPEGAQEASRIATRVVDRLLQSTSALSLDHEIGYDVTGACYDVGAYLSGTPECWAVPTPVEVKRAVSICLNVAASCGVESYVLKRRGMAVAALVLALQAKGHPVTVDVAQVATYGWGGPSNATYAKVARVIDANGSPLDLDRLVYAIAHPTMFRCVFQACTGDGWGGSTPESDSFPPGHYDLKFGGAHLAQAERWTDGGEKWIVEQYMAQTGA